MDRSKWHVVYNPIDLAPYTLTIQPDSNDPYVVFLSRLMEAKGAHLAIEVAKLTGKRLVIAGNIQPWDRPYFESRVRPFIDGKQIQFVGAVDNAAKNKLLGNAEAMLFPIIWEEPFGLVVGEAMACGTPHSASIPVLRGAMKEIIEPGKTGILVRKPWRKWPRRWGRSAAWTERRAELRSNRDSPPDDLTASRADYQKSLHVRYAGG